MAYEKQTWSNLPNKTTPLSAARLNHLETQYDEAVAYMGDRSLDLSWVSVSDFGAVADGVTDNTQAFQEAINLISPEGGTLFIPPGEYNILGFVEVPNTGNIKVLGYGATLTKPPSGRESVAFFAIRSRGNMGYGGGGSNFFFEGITTVGQAQIGHSATLLSAHHASNIVIENCVGIKSVGRGHWVDLNGCTHVRVSNCVVSGGSYNPDTPGEAIQADVSRPGSMSVPEDNPEWYDGLPSLDVRVNGCSFTRYTLEGLDLPAPMAFGCHTSPPDGLVYRDLSFEGNVCEPTQDRTTGVRGVVRFLSAVGVRVVGNTFHGGSVNTPLVSIQSGYSNEGDVEVDSRDVVVSNNSFLGGAGPQFYLSQGTGVVCSNNTFENAGGVAGLPASAIFVGTQPSQFSFVGNVMTVSNLNEANRGIQLNAGSKMGLASAVGNIIVCEPPGNAYGGAGSTNSRMARFGNIPA